MIYLTAQPPRKRGGWAVRVRMDQAKAGRILFPVFGGEIAAA